MFRPLAATFLMSLASASFPAHLTLLFSCFLLPIYIPMGVILWPRKTAGETQSRVEPSLNLGALLDLDLLTVAPKGATEQDPTLGSQSCCRQMQGQLTKSLEQMSVMRP